MTETLPARPLSSRQERHNVRDLERLAAIGKLVEGGRTVADAAWEVLSGAGQFAPLRYARFRPAEDGTPVPRPPDRDLERRFLSLLRRTRPEVEREAQARAVHVFASEAERLARVVVDVARGDFGSRLSVDENGNPVSVANDAGAARVRTDAARAGLEVLGLGRGSAGAGVAVQVNVATAADVLRSMAQRERAGEVLDVEAQDDDEDSAGA